MRIKCTVCGKYIEDFQQYAGWPDGHGKLLALLTNDEKNYIVQESTQKAKVSCSRPKRYRIAGQEFRVVSVIGPSEAYRRITYKKLDGSIIARGPWKLGFSELSPV